jgi:hypothetical protein
MFGCLFVNVSQVDDRLVCESERQTVVKQCGLLHSRDSQIEKRRDQLPNHRAIAMPRRWKHPQQVSSQSRGRDTSTGDVFIAFSLLAITLPRSACLNLPGNGLSRPQQLELLLLRPVWLQLLQFVLCRLCVEIVASQYPALKDIGAERLIRNPYGNLPQELGIPVTFGGTLVGHRSLNDGPLKESRRRPGRVPGGQHSLIRRGLGGRRECTRLSG